MIADMTRAQCNPARATGAALLLAITLLASGCAQPVEQDDARMSTSPEQVRRAPTQPAVRPQEDVAEKKSKPVMQASKQPVEDTTAAPPVEEQPAPEAAAPPAPAHTASELMGKSESEVTALMGTPARVEQRAASTVWVYQGGDCSLDVFFFLDMATSDERVLTVAPTAESATAAAAAAAAEAPAAGQSAADTADTGKSPEGTIVDACYGKLRRS
ncbi:MAG TPA: hypothetical protein VFG64_01615 [Dongiaceae bacterium]|nr:hypothetical protein [Dongiaceae bacterium]